MWLPAVEESVPARRRTRKPAPGGWRPRSPVPSVGRVETGTCDSCGDAERDDLVALHRLYVVPEQWDQQGSVTRVDEVERWCVPCRTHYPHEVLDDPS